MRRAALLALSLLLFTVSPACSQVFDAAQKVVGQVKHHVVKPGETLIELARHFGLGFNELADANPGVDPFLPDVGIKLTVPRTWILPDVPPTASVVINLSELRLYYFFNSGGRRRLMTFPVGIGSQGNDTPLGASRIREKRENPRWNVPVSIRAERPELPAVVPPGDDNPLGTHALRLSVPGIMVHGTNRPWGVGRKVSHGCIRLYPEDIPVLFDRVAVDDEVLIVRQPVKAGERGGRVYLEVHDDPATADPVKEAELVLLRRDLAGRVDPLKMLRALGEKRGVPVDVTLEPGAGSVDAGEGSPLPAGVSSAL